MQKKMTVTIKTFDELTLKELYEILRLRCEAYIVEQGGRYQDLDRIDYEAVHIFSKDDKGEITGCLRIFPKEEEPGTVQVGRVVTRDRLHGIGRLLMERAGQEAARRYGAKELYLTGRKSALGFYTKCGYYTASPEHFGEQTSYYEFRRSLTSPENA